MSFAFDDFERVYTEEACAVPESWRCLHLDVSALQRSVLLPKVSATGPELHLDVSALQKNVLLLDSGGVYTAGA